MVGYVKKMDIKEQLEEGLVKEQSSQTFSALPLYKQWRWVTIDISFGSCITSSNGFISCEKNKQKPVSSKWWVTSTEWTLNNS
jgi:hypothetical protein